MASPEPIYTPENCRFSHPLNWSVSVFWRDPCHDESWFSKLVEASEPDGLRLKSHRFTANGSSQFWVSSPPEVSPLTIVQRIKGRLQYVVRSTRPKALKRNFALHGFGNVTRDVVERYVADQLGHHQMADERVQERLRNYQIVHPEIDLSQPQRTSHGLFWYCLHLVLVHSERWSEIDDETLRNVSQMIEQSSRAKGYLLSEAGILPDHVHIIAGCPFDQSPLEVALGFLNNLAYVHGMKRVFQFGGFIGTVGEYTFNALNDGVSAQPG